MNVTVDELKKAIDEAEDMVLLDVRTPQEYERSKIYASINIPVDEISGKIAGIISDKNKKIYVYCLSGSRSGFATEILESLGYTNVSNVKNGLLGWRAKGYPVE